MEQSTTLKTFRRSSLTLRITESPITWTIPQHCLTPATRTTDAIPRTHGRWQLSSRRGQRRSRRSSWITPQNVGIRPFYRSRSAFPPWPDASRFCAVNCTLLYLMEISMKRLIFESWLLLLRFESIMRFREFKELHRAVREAPVCPTTSAEPLPKERLCSAMDYACVFYFKRVLCLQRSAATTLL